MHAKPELSVPALIGSLRDPVDEVRWTSASSLETFGTDAKSAVPALLKAFGDPCPGVREDAGYALQKIDPEAAAKVGVK
jgi:HEAT repeat protein